MYTGVQVFSLYIYSQYVLILWAFTSIAQDGNRFHQHTNHKMFVLHIFFRCPSLSSGRPPHTQVPKQIPPPEKDNHPRRASSETSGTRKCRQLDCEHISEAFGRTQAFVHAWVFAACAGQIKLSKTDLDIPANWYLGWFFTYEACIYHQAIRLTLF